MNEINIENLTNVDMLQIDQAARGCVSGYLDEWPLLRKAFVNLGLTPSRKMAASEMRDMSRLIILLLEQE